MPNIEYLLPNIGRTAASGDASGKQTEFDWVRTPGHENPPGQDFP